MADTAVATVEAPPLDEVMLAMDVVDTLRHQDLVVERELSGEARRVRMIERLREIYRGQGITVPDRILAEGVAALEQERFVYKPRTGGFAFTLARLYVRRGAIGRRVGIIAAVVLVLILGWYFLIERPGNQRAEAERIELSETIPADLATLSAAIADEANDPAVAASAAQTARDGTAAAAAGNAAEAREAVADLRELLGELRLTFDVRIVSRPGVLSGIDRYPDGSDTPNYYLIVEAIGPDGEAIPRAITSEEDQRTRTVTMWGVRVPEAVYAAVEDDYFDDGIVNDTLVGEKERGDLAIEWAKPVLGGMITEW
ncbi:MAG: hypothetical protein KIS96_05135 [Bauldia sp.]|nr:hypothetical protein [Bauldia sp.]